MEIKEKIKDEKKNGADTEMGYCPFEHKAGRGALGERGAGARHKGHRCAAWGVQARGTACGTTCRGARAIYIYIYIPVVGNKRKKKDEKKKWCRH